MFFKETKILTKPEVLGFIYSRYLLNYTGTKEKILKRYFSSLFVVKKRLSQFIFPFDHFTGY